MGSRVSPGPRCVWGWRGGTGPSDVFLAGSCSRKGRARLIIYYCLSYSPLPIHDMSRESVIPFRERLLFSLFASLLSATWAQFLFMCIKASCAARKSVVFFLRFAPRVTGSVNENLRVHEYLWSKFASLKNDTWNFEKKKDSKKGCRCTNSWMDDRMQTLFYSHTWI